PGALLGDGSGVVTIMNDAVASTVSISSPDATASESGDTAKVVVTRVGDITAPLNVTLDWSGIAVLSVDYTLTVTGGVLSSDGRTLTLNAGVSSATITIVPKTDTYAEPVESFIATIVPNAAYGVGSPST